MTGTLHLGVIEQPYDNREGDETLTTGDVASILEAEYHIMEIFYYRYEDQIVEAITDSLQGSLENLLMGQEPASNPLAEAESYIENLFRKFLDRSVIEGLGVLGVPTKAALEGLRTRLGKIEYGPRRPSFIDTGLYQASFKAWFSGMGFDLNAVS